MALITFNHIAAHLSDVTPEHIGRCHAVLKDGVAFYMVESEEDSTVEYRVWKSRSRGYQCTCPAGREGFAHCTNLSGVCKHVRWTVATRLEETDALKEQERLNAESRERAELLAKLNITHSDVDTETLRRMVRKNAVKQPARPYAPLSGNRPFSLFA